MRINGEAIRAIRERSGLSVSDLGRLLGKSHSYVSNIEAGRRQASPAMAKKIAEVLQVPLVAILPNPAGAAS